MTRLLSIAALAAAVLATTPAGAQPTDAPPHEISSLDERPSRVGPAEFFTGSTVIDPLFGRNGTRQVGGAVVTLAPGARTLWHTHPAGQTLVVTEGVGWVQGRGAARREVRAGDVVWAPPGVAHWHGGTAEHTMVHISVLEPVDGQVVTWLEPVTDAEYLGTDD